MSPEETKAKELIEKFYNSGISTNTFRKEDARNAALICVDEMIIQNGKYYLLNGGKLTEEIYKKENAYLFEVKEAIKNQ